MYAPEDKVGTYSCSSRETVAQHHEASGAGIRFARIPGGQNSRARGIFHAGGYRRGAGQRSTSRMGRRYIPLDEPEAATAPIPHVPDTRGADYGERRASDPSAYLAAPLLWVLVCALVRACLRLPWRPATDTRMRAYFSRASQSKKSRHGCAETYHICTNCLQPAHGCVIVRSMPRQRRYASGAPTVERISGAPAMPDSGTYAGGVEREAGVACPCSPLPAGSDGARERASCSSQVQGTSRAAE